MSRTNRKVRNSKPYEFEEDDDPFIVVGIDAEWVYESEGRNRILSYQFAVHNDDTGRMATLIVYTKDGQRISLERGLSMAFLKARRRGVIDKVPRRFVIAGHFTRADLTTFADFGFFKRRIGAVRKSYATTEIPLQLSLASSEGPVRCGAMVVDTMMLTSAGTSVETIGNLLGEPKVNLPNGYSKDRMDLFLRDHPDLFEKYALTDAVIPAKWVARTYSLLLQRLGIGKKVITLGGAAVELVRKQAKIEGIDLNEFLGQRQAEATLRASGAADRNCRAGVSRWLQRRYRTRLFSRRERIGGPRHQIGLPDGFVVHRFTRLAHCAALHRSGPSGGDRRSNDGGARRIQVPQRDAVSMPAGQGIERAGGSSTRWKEVSWCTGPELVVAIGMGAEIIVKDGYRVDWIPGSIRLFEDIARQIGEIRAEAKAQQPPDLVLDKTVKELVNSVYGKIAQSVAGMRIIQDDRDSRRVFNTMYGTSDRLGPSAITNAMMAAYCTGLVRALLLETIGRLPPGTWVGTATTDGFLSTCGLGDIDQTGPVATAFRAARGRITPGDATIWEVKHSIPRALVTKTRGTYTVAPEDWNGQSVVLAKAGYMTPEEAKTLTEIEQCRAWIERYRERHFETKMRSKSLTSLRQQHLFEVDLQSVKRDVRWNADYDMKRKLVKVRNVDGLITADTVPWRTIDEFEQARDLLEDWKRSQRRVLKTKQDYDDMMAWGAARASRRKTGTRGHNALSPVASAVLKILAHRTSGIVTVLESPIWRKAERPKFNARTARLMTALCGVKVTETNVKDAKRRGAGPDDLVDSIASLTDDDRRFLTAWFRLFPVAPEVLDIAEMLCEQGSAASAELDDLFLDATAFDTSFGDPDDPDMATTTRSTTMPAMLRATSKRPLRSTPTRYEDSLREGLEAGLMPFPVLSSKRHLRPRTGSGCSQRK